MVDVPGVGPVDSWVELVAVDGELVTYRDTVLLPDGRRVDSSETLRFRRRGAIETSLVEAGFRLDEMRDAPDRPGAELVFVATRVG